MAVKVKVVVKVKVRVMCAEVVKNEFGKSI